MTGDINRTTKAYDLAGQVFGSLTAVERAEKQKRDKRGGVWWHCRCECGNETDVLATMLKTGRKTHCGCQKKTANYHYKDITGQKFNRLTALYPTDARTSGGRMVWHCRCDCGNELDVSYNDLLYSPRKSCGCQKEEHNEELHNFLTHIGGTSLEMLKSHKVWANNTTGARGVYLIKGKYVAKIVFQKKAYYLGTYSTFEEAAEVRRRADEMLRDEICDYYAAWSEKAEEDPDWADDNPISIKAEKVDSEIRLVILPALI